MKRRPAEKITTGVVRLLAKERRNQGINYEDMAGLCGLHATSLSLIERRKRQPTFVNLCRIAGALGVRLSELVQRAEDGDTGR